MKWSWKIARLAGIDVYLHATFLLLVGWLGLNYAWKGQSLGAFLQGLGFVLTIFGIIVLHELGHALAARRYGIQTLDITLLPIGGVARMERLPEDPRQELVVALAGPAVNVAIVVLLSVLLAPTILLGAFQPPHWAGGGFLRQLLLVNVWLVLFNLIPAFPMDGGRVLRALLARRLDYARATRIAARVGQGLAVGFALVGVFTNPLLIFVALFVWTGAAAEAGMVQLKSDLGGVPLGRVMVTDYVTLTPQDPLARAVEHILAGFQQDFPVVEAGRVVGVLTRRDLVRALRARGSQTAVGEIMQQDFQSADASEPAEAALARLQDGRCPALPVVEQGRLVGVLTAEHVSEFLLFKEALRRRVPPKLAVS
jgi:Zn-dependent protease/predicted transcriptional regulator